MALSTPPALDMCILNDEMEPTSIDKLRAGGVLVVDFWTTRCERCPAALDHLNKMAVDLGENAPVVFASMNCDDADFAKELIEENDWPNVVHCYMDEANKNVVKEKMGLKSVPFLCVVGKDGMIAYTGAFKGAELEKLIRDLMAAGPNAEAAPEKAAEENRALVLDEDF